ncbi:Cas9 inhibitor AcrIIA9 family protein [Paenibacillus chibensis]|uniref:Cas9 inhibitor AcrIIA9 family protein n=1 Tax=Paenibacillus chibensis TaxID=59846 RepID=A0ABU6PSQ2_9BACL|nr:Cas9 inhibitor AcrIIA9 family protein [Paenibacillus chibensis]
MQEAITKLQSEIEKNKTNPYIQVVGEFLIKHVQANPANAEKILDADKTIGNSLEAMKKEAQKKQVNGMAMLTDEEGFAIVLKYFGFEGTAIPGVGSSEQPDASSDSSFDVKLDDFL